MNTKLQHTTGLETQENASTMTLFATESGYERTMSVAVKFHRSTGEISPLWVCQLPTSGNFVRKIRNARKPAIKTIDYRMKNSTLHRDEEYAKLIIGVDSAGVTSYAVMSLDNHRLNMDLTKAPKIRRTFDSTIIEMLNNWVGEDVFQDTKFAPTKIRNSDIVAKRISDPGLAEVLPYLKAREDQPKHTTEDKNFGTLTGEVKERKAKAVPTVERRGKLDVKKLLTEKHMIPTPSEPEIPTVAGHWEPLLVGLAGSVKDEAYDEEIRSVLRERDAAFSAETDSGTAFHPKEWRCVESFGLGSK